MQGMYIVDDPMLALIARFVAADRDPDVSEQAFMQRQVEAIRSYVAQFPDHERNARAMEWVEHSAKQYRRAWQRKYLSRWMHDLRCPDCPLSGAHSILHCEIHQLWSELLSRYAKEEMTSREYVEQTLQLLNENKEKLKGLPRSREGQ